MRLYYWSNSSFPSTNANTINVLYMCDALNNYISINLFLFSTENIELNNKNFKAKLNFKINNIGKYSITNLLFNFFKFIIFSKFNFNDDIIYTRSIYIFFISSLFKLKVYYEIHNTQRTNFHKFLFYCAKKNRKSILIFITKKLCEKYKFDSKYLVLPSGSIVNIEKHELLDKKKFILSKNNTLSICYVGSDHPGKGVERVCKLSKLLPSFNFEIVGLGLDKYTWPPNCKIRGRISSSASLEIMSKCHIFLLPNHKKVYINSQRDIGEFTSPLKLFEYFSSYGCILASNITILKEILNDNNSILLTESNYVEEAVQAINDLNIYRNKLVEIADFAYYDLLNNYSWEIRAKKIYETFV